LSYSLVVLDILIIFVRFYLYNIGAFYFTAYTKFEYSQCISSRMWENLLFKTAMFAFWYVSTFGNIFRWLLIFVPVFLRCNLKVFLFVFSFFIAHDIRCYQSPSDYRFCHLLNVMTVKQHNLICWLSAVFIADIYIVLTYFVSFAHLANDRVSTIGNSNLTENKHSQ